jgi:ubiquitin-protein ligase
LPQKVKTLINSKAKKEIIKRCEKLKNVDLNKKGFSLKPIGDNMFKWEIRLFGFEKKLEKDLKNHAEKYNYDKTPSLNETIICEMLFKIDFPEKPPVIRLLRPRLKYGTGNVSFSGTFDTNSLLHDDWEENLDLITLIESIRNDLIDGKARIDMKTNIFYDNNTFKDTYNRQKKNLKKFYKKNGYKGKLKAYSIEHVQKKINKSYIPRHNIDKGFFNYYIRK